MTGLKGEKTKYCFRGGLFLLLLVLAACVGVAAGSGSIFFVRMMLKILGPGAGSFRISVC